MSLRERHVSDEGPLVKWGLWSVAAENQVLLDPGVLVAEVHADLGPSAKDPPAIDVLGRAAERS